MTKEAYKSGRIKYAVQDGSREFISLLACACADGTTTPPALIYQGKSGDLQDTWMHDLHEGEEAYFTSAENGWSCDALGLAWLRRFDQNTRHKSSRRRLLIVDGHSSHVNWGFVSCADELRILLLILPPHTTHRLQPLDVGLFSPLSQAYSTELQNYTHGGQGWVSMTKRMFWTLFKKAWMISFTEKNIKKAFESTGIWPYNPEKTIRKLQKPVLIPTTPVPLSIRTLSTPLDCRDLRQLGQLSPSLKNVAQLQRFAMMFATKLELTKHENGQLKAALFCEKERRTRSKRLGLTGEVATGAPEFYSPTRVIKAKEFQETKAATQEEETRQKALRKVEKEHARVQKLAQQQETKLQKEMVRTFEKERKDAEKAANRAAIEERKLDRLLAKQAKQITDSQRKLAAIKRKQAAAAAAAASSQKRADKAAPIRRQKAARKPSIPRNKVAAQTTSPRAVSPSKTTADSAPSASVIDLTAAGPAFRSRSGRTVSKPSRFEH